MHPEIPASLQTNIEQAADGLIEEENDKIAKAVDIKYFFSRPSPDYCFRQFQTLGDLFRVAA